MPSAYSVFRKPYVCIPTFFIISCFIEAMQYFFELGIAEIDDVLTNTLGGVIGLLIYGILLLFHLIFKSFNKKDEEKKKKK